MRPEFERLTHTLIVKMQVLKLLVVTATAVSALVSDVPSLNGKTGQLFKRFSVRRLRILMPTSKVLFPSYR